MTPEQEAVRVKLQNRVDADALMKERILRGLNSRIAGEQDSAGTQALKYAGAATRGTGEGLASLADMPHVGGHWFGEVLKNAWEEGHGRPYTRTASDWPVTEAYNKTMPAAPVGYETTNDVAAVLGPAVIETALTGGFGAPAAFANAGRAARLVGGATRGVGKTALDLGTGVAGSEVGKGVGQAVGGDIGAEIGQFGGALAAPALTSVAAPAAARYAAAPSSKAPLSFGDLLNPLNLVGLTSGASVVPKIMESGLTPSNLAALAVPAGIYGARAARDKIVGIPALQPIIQALGQNPSLANVLSSSVVGATGAQNVAKRPLLPRVN
jgi:hypothetical protein